MISRRGFLRQAGAATMASLLPQASWGAAAPACSFFIVGDTHYCADEADIKEMDETSALYNSRLVKWLNELPGTEFSAEVGGGKVPEPKGVIHAGDIVDNGDKGMPKLKMAETEIAAFSDEWGLNGGDGKLKWAVREVHGNHDGPRGDTVVVEEIKKRNKRRAGLANVSPNGLHYSWDWEGVHFVALGLVVSATPEVTRRRRYAGLDSLAFLQQDLAEKVGSSGRPVVLVHHVDVARYSEAVPDEKVVGNEWDYADVQAYYATLQKYNVAAAICGHTHVRNIFRWNGTKNTKGTEGVPFLNTDNGGHFGSEAQAFLHVSLGAAEMVVREFSTKNGWESGAWTPQVWRFALQA
jgi:predicted phosphodiesterase